MGTSNKPFLFRED
jgi:ATP-dependent Zn protease